MNLELLDELSTHQKLPKTDQPIQAIADHEKSRHTLERSSLRKLSPAMRYIFEEAQRELGVAFADDSEAADSDDLKKITDRVASRLGFELASFERDEVISLLEQGNQEFSLLQPLVDDPNISDIIISDHTKVEVQQGRRNFTTDITFPSQESYEAFVERLLLKAGTTYSTAKPIADGMIGTFARIHAVHKCLCETGPYLTIRINRFSKITLEDLLGFGLAPRAIIDYIQAMIKSGQTIMVAGEVGTGKTTLVRALAASIPTHESILVIEDTPEIQLAHPHVRYMRTREANTDDAGLVKPSECIRAGMRMAMNRIIFGEIRDAIAAESFIDVCASGHPGVSTLHARNSAETISRLELFLGRAQQGVTRNVIYEQIAKAIQVIVYVDVCHITGKRRIMEVKEIGPVADGVIRQRDIFTYKCATDSSGTNTPEWIVKGRITAHREELFENGFDVAALSDRLQLEESNV